VRRRSQRPGAARPADHRFGQGGRDRRPRGAHDDSCEDRYDEDRYDEDRSDEDRYYDDPYYEDHERRRACR
jgi:hypothetical protein